ncbi:hypothetical protein HPB47_001398 [Ixodes persulcatus]|uniref:Uncharacterized protein n=1 Tax=Ixodes persulcatus TaxID=34615 RepID=A0AC60PPV9_IXOPE|nr:hypothetical protein HPB47_001398 [Ixodes persulcatus]
MSRLECLVLLGILSSHAWALSPVSPYSCKSSQLPDKLVAEIRGYAPVVNAIIKRVMHGSERNRTYQELVKFVDKFGSRIAGSQNLENSIDYMVTLLSRQGLDAVYTEDAKVPHWERGEESAWLLKPRLQRLNMLGLGGSIGTPTGGIEASVLVVRSFDQLRANASKARGKIVVFNEDFSNYSTTVKYRVNGAAEAYQAGAVAALVRSVTPFSIASPHTGWMTYRKNTGRIPSACITVEDAELLERFQQSGKDLLVSV